jgi:IclR family acetate operon transcriptional repressor
VAVKQVQSAGRVLATFEALVRHQPIGVGALARELGDDKSAVQRALTTLAASGWIAPAAAGRGWQASSRVLVLANLAQHGFGIVDRARPVLEALRDATSETVILNVPDAGRVVVLDIAVSPQLVRTAPHVGLVLPPTDSAGARAILAHLTPDEVAGYLGAVPSSEILAGLEADRARGWSLNAGDVTPGASSVGAAVLGVDGRPLASLTISAPTNRMPPASHARLGRLVADAAAGLS